MSRRRVRGDGDQHARTQEPSSEVEWKMAVLVTGAAGYIGSHMVWNLLDRGEEVVALDNLSTGFEWAIPGDVEFVFGDVGDAQLVKRTVKEKRIEAVIHFAGSVVVPESVSQPLRYYMNNTCKSRSLIEAVIDAGVGQFIFSSTAAVYGTVGELPVREDAPTRPESPYGRSKLMTEMMLADAAAAHDFRFAALRYFNVAGADPKKRTGQSTNGATHLIKVACETALGKRAFIEVFGCDYPTRDGTCVRDFIHVSDLVEAHYKALMRLRSGGPSIVANCGYGHGHSVLEVLDTVRRLTGSNFPVRYIDRRIGDLVSVVADSSRARAELDWNPHHDNLQYIIADALAWEDHLGRTNQPRFAHF
jgi:UDP-glucose 4-epimerase